MFARNSGAKMAAPLLWAPGIFALFLQDNLHARNIPRFRAGGVFWVFLGGGVPILFLWARGFFCDCRILSGKWWKMFPNRAML